MDLIRGKNMLNKLIDFLIDFYYFIRVAIFLACIYPSCLLVYLVIRFIGSDKKTADLFWRQNLG